MTGKREAPPLPVGRRSTLTTLRVVERGVVPEGALDELRDREARTAPGRNLGLLLEHWERLASAVIKDRVPRAHSQNRDLAETVAELVPVAREWAGRMNGRDLGALFDVLWLALAARDLEADLQYARGFAAGEGTRRGGHKGAARAHGPHAEREAERERWRARFAELRQRFPEAPKKTLLGIVENETGETFRTLRRYIKQR